MRREVVWGSCASTLGLARRLRNLGFAHSNFANAATPASSHIPQANNTMGAPFDFAPERPEHIDQILNGLDRYNPETTAVFQDYVMQQCEQQTYDCYANLALLKLYVTFLGCKKYLQDE